MISTIIIEPALHDPLDLLRDGACGARPPVLAFWGCAGWHMQPELRMDGPIPLGWSVREPLHKTSLGWCHHAKVMLRRALVLAHAGRPVPEGCDRMDWALHRGAGRPGRSRTYSHTPFPPNLPEALEWPFEQAWIATNLHQAGRLILLDDEMQEVSP